MQRNKQKVYICLGTRGAFLPEGCEPEWMIKVNKLEDITDPSRAHAYILPDNSIYVWNYEGDDKIRLNSTIWGLITGNLSDQTDLKEALDKKADKVFSFTEDNVATLTLDGNYKDSGEKLSDYAKIIDLNNYELKSNKKALYAGATNNDEYPTIPSVIQYVQSAISGLTGGGLKIPVSLDKETDLQAVNNYTDGDFFYIQDMDTTLPGHTGKVWVNTVGGVKQFFKSVDQYQSPDGTTILLNGSGLLEVNQSWLNTQLGNYQPKAPNTKVRGGKNGAWEEIKGSDVDLWNTVEEVTSFKDGFLTSMLNTLPEGVLTQEVQDKLNAIGGNIDSYTKTEIDNLVGNINSDISTINTNLGYKSDLGIRGTATRNTQNSSGSISLDGTNLNNIHYTGFYYCISCVNAPVTGNGFLVVESITTNDIQQTYTVKKGTTSTNIPVYQRQCVSGVWTEWILISSRKSESDFTEITGSVTLTNGSGSVSGISYPSGFTQKNCYAIVSVDYSISGNPEFGVGNGKWRLVLNPTNMNLVVSTYDGSVAGPSGTRTYKILLIKYG